MARIPLVIAPKFIERCLQSALLNEVLHLGFITNNRIYPAPETLLTVPTFAAEEFTTGGWTRPSLTMSMLGAYNPGSQQWELPTSLEWEFTPPAGGFTILQAFVVIDGSSTSGSTTGDLVGFTTGNEAAITYPGGITASYKFPSKLKSLTPAY